MKRNTWHILQFHCAAVILFAPAPVWQMGLIGLAVTTAGYFFWAKE